MKKLLTVLVLAVGFAFTSCSKDDCDDTIGLTTEELVTVNFGVSGIDKKILNYGSESGKVDLSSWEHKIQLDGYEIKIFKGNDLTTTLSNLSITASGTLVGAVTAQLLPGTYKAYFGPFASDNSLRIKDSFVFQRTDTFVSFTVERGIPLTENIAISPYHGVITLDWNLPSDYDIDISSITHRQSVGSAQKTSNLFSSNNDGELDYAYLTSGVFTLVIKVTLDGAAVFTETLTDVTISRGQHIHYNMVFNEPTNDVGFTTSGAAFGAPLTRTITN